MLADGHIYSVLIVSSAAKVTEFICDLLSSSVFAPIISVSTASEAKRLLITAHFDLIIINTPIKDEFGCQFAVDVAQSTKSGILILAKCEHLEQVSFEVEKEGVLTITSPASKQTLYQAVKLLIATRERLKKLEKKYESLQVKMAEIRIVNRAKWVLIDHLQMTERQAHRYIEKQAMDMRMTRREVAERIIEKHQP